VPGVAIALASVTHNIFTDVFNATGTLTTTIGARVYAQPADGT